MEIEQNRSVKIGFSKHKGYDGNIVSRNKDRLTRAYPTPDFGKEEISIDSLKLRLPIENVSIIDNNLTSKYVLVNEDTGEIDDYFSRQNKLVKPGLGYSVKWGVEKMNLARKEKEFLTIGIPAKLLHSKYFEGITVDNVELLHKQLMKQGVAAFTVEDFLKHSSCTDIDFKQDAIYKGDFKKQLKKLELKTQPGRFKDKGCRAFYQKQNQGIEFSTRKTTSFKSTPFLKYYHKGIELQHQSATFSSKYLSGMDYLNVVRCETTIKNKKHFRYLWGHDATSLEYVLKMPYEDRLKAFTHARSCHLEQGSNKIREKVSRLTLKGDKLIIYELLRLLLSEGKEFEEIKGRLMSLLPGKVMRSRKRKMLEELHELYRQENGCELSPILEDIFWN